MLYDGIRLAEGSSVTNMTIDSGTSFPVDATAGELFFRTDESRMYVFNSAKWKMLRVEAGASLPTSPTPDLGDLFFKTDDQVLYVRKSIGWVNVASTYVLPVASAGTLGGVKQGTNVTIAGDGTISSSGGASPSANNTWTAAQRGGVVALSPGATVTPDFSASNNFSLVAGQNFTLAFPSNVVAGQSGIIAITQDATGNRVVTFGSGWLSAGGVPPVLSTAANSVDYLSYYVETSGRIFVSAILNVA